HRSPRWSRACSLRHRHTSALPTCRRQRPFDIRDGDRDRSIDSRAYRSASAVRVPFVTQALHLELYAPNSIYEHVIAVQFGNTLSNDCPIYVDRRRWTSETTSEILHSNQLDIVDGFGQR